MSEATHAGNNYLKIYLCLVVLLIISIIGPTMGILAVTLITAFGVAVAKATLVTSYFMHLNVEKRYVWFILLTMLVFLLVLFAGVAPDVMRHSGQNWGLVAPIHHPAPLPAE